MASGPQTEPVLAFVHIPRTGGGTATSAIARGYDRPRSAGNVQKDPERAATKLERFAAQRRTGRRAVADHIPYGLYRRYLPPDARYITFLRDPLDRVISQYHFHARQGTKKVEARWRHLAELDRAERANGQIELDGSTTYSLDEGLELGLPIYDNLATRYLYGGESIMGDLPGDALARARENVAGFTFVGITERLDESIVLLGRALGVGVMPYVARHINPKRPAVVDVPAALRDAIAERNFADIELYREARLRFDALADAAPNLADDVAELRRRCADLAAAAD